MKNKKPPTLIPRSVMTTFHTMCQRDPHIPNTTHWDAALKWFAVKTGIKGHWKIPPDCISKSFRTTEDTTKLLYTEAMDAINEAQSLQQQLTASRTQVRVLQQMVDQFRLTDVARQKQIDDLTRELAIAINRQKYLDNK